MSFSQHVAHAARKPSGVATLQPSAFSDQWPDKPAKSVAVGLLLLSADDIRTCRSEAAKEATECHPGGNSSDPDWLEARNDALLHWALSRAMCNPNDASKPFFPMQDEDTIADALTPAAIRHLWDEIERASIVDSPVRAQATNEDIQELIDLFQSGTLEKLATPCAIRLRKLASFMLDELVAVASLDFEEAEAG